MPVFDEYFPFDKGFGATANAARWAKMGQFFVPDGVLNWKGGLSGLAATLAPGNITVQPGAVWVHGYYAELQTAQTFAVGTTGTVVAGVDLANEVMSLYYNDGSLGYPACTQSTTVWEIPLWGVSGNSLIDFRSNISQGQGVCTGGGAYMGTYTALGPWVQIAPANTTYFPILVSEITHPCLALVMGTFQIGTVNAQYAQNAWFNFVLQNNLADMQQSVLHQALFFPGGGGINAPGWYFGGMAALTYQFWIPTPGKKTWGIKVSCGTGPFNIEVSSLHMNVLQVGSISNQ